MPARAGLIALLLATAEQRLANILVALLRQEVYSLHATPDHVHTATCQGMMMMTVQ